ncbi:protein FAM177A1-like isoform X1 [Stegodyphus dumicola]|uniref:protein FAM177A1-like isoform X1 n=1 Tax=Stegodyphus dumicola TaxID=202533 RepID=UPI0015AFA853|nr:protein FAM177A1-like isoform X1 [Stegodyphus dumicola]
MTNDNPNSQSDKMSFTEINLSEIKEKKLPKRLVYFSDGILEEYSSDEDICDGECQDTQPLIDAKTLPWIPYFGYLIWWIGSRTLSVCDYLGENLAWFLGITSPKFQYELEQYEKIVKEEEELQKYIKSENAGWITKSSEDSKHEPIELQPQPKLLDVQTKETEMTEPLDEFQKYSISLSEPVKF